MSRGFVSLGDAAEAVFDGRAKHPRAGGQRQRDEPHYVTEQVGHAELEALDRRAQGHGDSDALVEAWRRKNVTKGITREGMINMFRGTGPDRIVNGRRPSGAPLYHRGSVFANPEVQKISRWEKWRLRDKALAKLGPVKALRCLEQLLFGFHGPEGVTFPTYAQLAAAMGCHRDTVRVSLRTLEAARFIKKTRRICSVSHGNLTLTRQTSNSYTFPLCRTTKSPPQKQQESPIKDSISGFPPETREVSKNIHLPSYDRDSALHAMEESPERGQRGLAAALRRLQMAVERERPPPKTPKSPAVFEGAPQIRTRRSEPVGFPRSAGGLARSGVRGEIGQ